MPRQKAIDHLVVSVPDLNAAAVHIEKLGFILTPHASHNDEMGTSNRLVQLSEKNFIELLEVDRPDNLIKHRPDLSPPVFGFGTHIKRFVEKGPGIAMLVFASNDAAADNETFSKDGLQTYQPYHFERLATLPGGDKVTVGFSLCFVTNPLMPDIAFFCCHQHATELFWKDAYQHHDNGAEGIEAVYICADKPSQHRDFLEKLTGGSSIEHADGLEISCLNQTIRVITPDALITIAPGFTPTPRNGPFFAGVSIRTKNAELIENAPEIAAGIFIKWSHSKGN